MIAAGGMTRGKQWYRADRRPAGRAVGRGIGGGTERAVRTDKQRWACGRVSEGRAIVPAERGTCSGTERGERVVEGEGPSEESYSRSTPAASSSLLSVPAATFILNDWILINR